MTSTGLPLADTHYTQVGDKQKCFIYVFEENDSCFFIVRSNDEIARIVKSKGHKFIRSAFPKTRDRASWYTMLIDDSYTSFDEVFEILKLVIDNLN